MLPHEKLKLLIPDPAVLLTIHHLPFLQPLQGTPLLSAEAALGHQLGWILDGLLGEPGVQPVQASGPPAPAGLVPKGHFEVVLVAKQHYLPVLHCPVSVALTEGQPLVLYGLGEEA